MTRKVSRHGRQTESGPPAAHHRYSRLPVINHVIHVQDRPLRTLARPYTSCRIRRMVRPPVLGIWRYTIFVEIILQSPFNQQNCVHSLQGSNDHDPSPSRTATTERPEIRLEILCRRLSSAANGHARSPATHPVACVVDAQQATNPQRRSSSPLNELSARF